MNTHVRSSIYQIKPNHDTHNPLTCLAGMQSVYKIKLIIHRFHKTNVLKYSFVISNHKWFDENTYYVPVVGYIVLGADPVGVIVGVGLIVGSRGRVD